MSGPESSNGQTYVYGAGDKAVCKYSVFHGASDFIQAITIREKAWTVALAVGVNSLHGTPDNGRTGR